MFVLIKKHLMLTALFLFYCGTVVAAEYDALGSLCDAAKENIASDPALAVNQFSEYQNKLGSFFKKNPDLKSDKSIKRKVRACNKEQKKAYFANAMPLLEVGLQACEKARDDLRKKEAGSAQKSFELYVQKREAAQGVYKDIAREISVRSKIKMCDRLPEKIAVLNEKKSVMAAVKKSAKKPVQKKNKQASSKKKTVKSKKPMEEFVDFVPEKKVVSAIAIEPVVRSRLEEIQDELGWALEGCEAYLDLAKLPKMLIYDEEATAMAKEMLAKRRISAQQYNGFKPILQKIQNCKTQISARVSDEEMRSAAAL